MLRGMRIRIRRPAALRLLVPVLSALTTGAAALSGAQAPTGAPARPAMYTDAQAAMGETLYRQSCAACHGATLTGGTAPPLTGPTFDTSWSDPRVTIADVFFIARTTMPPRASNTLTAQDHAAVFAYLLKMNGFPAGATPLTATSEALESAHVSIANQAARPAAPEFIPGAAAAAPAASGPDQAALTRASQSTDWLFHTHDYGGTRFSPLQQIDATTAARHARRLPAGAQFRDRRAAVGAADREASRRRDLRDGAGRLRGSRADRAGAERAQRPGMGRRISRLRWHTGLAVQHRAEAGRAGVRHVEESEGDPDGRQRRVDVVCARHRERRSSRRGHQSGA